MQPLLSALNHPAFYLPKRIEGSSMTSYLKAQFKLYFSIIEEIEEPMVQDLLQPIKPALTHFCNAVTAAVDAHLRGDPASAFAIFESAINPLKQFLVMDTFGGAKPEALREKPYYRIRTGIEKPYQKEDIFHLGFSKRAKVNIQRYSIAGLPCLYLSNSIFVCWKELNQPKLEETQVSRFVQTDPYLNILDLDFTPYRLQRQLESFYGAFFNKEHPYHISYYNLWTGTLVNWPLMIACSLQVREQNEPFKQEYIVPQLLLQWVMRQRDISGIRYFSNKTAVFPTMLFTKYSNYVFPPKNMRGEYCSDLRKWFKLTDPVIPTSLNFENQIDNYESGNTRLDNYMIDSDNNIGVEYRQTDFGKMELSMRELHATHF